MKISKLRREQGLSQVALAQKIGCHPSVIAQVEAGHRKPWPLLKKKIAKVFDVDWREVES